MHDLAEFSYKGSATVIGALLLPVLTGNNLGKQYFDAGGQLVDQTHGGSVGVNGGTACVVCHNVRTSDPGGAFGSMEDLAEQRGGIWQDTPVPVIP